jgi:hypothetical protein
MSEITDRYERISSQFTERVRSGPSGRMGRRLAVRGLEGP